MVIICTNCYYLLDTFTKLSLSTNIESSRCVSLPVSQMTSSLMAEMGAVLELHSDPAVLEAAARTYLSLCGEETAWSSTAQTARDALVQGWVDHLTALLEDSIKVNYTLWTDV